MVKYQTVDETDKVIFSKDELHPPRAPSARAQAPEKTSRKSTNLTLEEAFIWLVNNSSFKRSMVEFIKKVVPGTEGKYHRFNKVEMNKAFQEKIDGIKDAQEIKKLIETSTPHRNYANVMKEFKEVLKNRKAKM